jgi:hypothetical protein
VIQSDVFDESAIKKAPGFKVKATSSRTTPDRAAAPCGGGVFLSTIDADVAVPFFVVEACAGVQAMMPNKAAAVTGLCNFK